MTKQEYNDLNNTLHVYDGRGKGIDVYTCDTCGSEMHTRYRDLGVTPFTMACRRHGCKGMMTHNRTISESIANFIMESSPMIAKDRICYWYRPSYRYYCNADEWIKSHLENGGLILDETPLRKVGLECSVTNEEI